jgi:DNA-binding transcriptional MerR regulator
VLEVNSAPAPGPNCSGRLSASPRPLAAGVSARTLGDFERADLTVTSIARNDAGRRRYQQIDLDWITICTKLRATGMPIKTISRYAELGSAGHGKDENGLSSWSHPMPASPNR